MKRANIKINGIVQGVGFRPFIHRQVTKFSLCGWIRNTSEGVELELEGSADAIEGFLAELRPSAPKLAYIESVRLTDLAEPKGYKDFQIIGSKELDSRNTLISPDVAICEDCLRELRDPADRRHGYAFINCTNCGPRFSIIKDVPYDRAKTTMAAFPMCEDCAAEYGDIENRRYHAQPDCCSACGPQLFYLDAEAQPVEGEPVALAAKALKEGRIVAVKGLGGIHLACRCDDEAVVSRLRSRKLRDEKPFALMCRDMDAVKRFCKVSAEEEAALTSHRRPIVLLEKKDKGSFSYLSDNSSIGVMLPYTPLHYLLFDNSPEALVMTSGNRSDTPIQIKNEEALTQLRGIADGFLLHDRDIENRCDDSLLRVVEGQEYLLRRSRGYAPFPLTLSGGQGGTLACGAEQKATFSLSKQNYVFLAPHIGDLKNVQTLENYESGIKLYERLFDAKPQRLVCDLHPDYLSTNYAEERAKKEALPLLRVQHHHAHMTACMADNNLDEPCIGIIWDGTGYGGDGTIWGGEFLLGDYSGFERRGHLRYIPLPGGDKVTKELWRTAISLLTEAGEAAEEFFPPKAVQRVQTMLSANLNCPKSSSMGRLFDGVSAILGIKTEASYEGQGAVLLEAAADEGVQRVYPYEIVEEKGCHCIDWRPLISAICEEKRSKLPVGNMAAAFLNTLCAMAVELCQRIREESGVSKAVLSGGTFQNQYLLKRLTELLQEEGFAVYRHRRVSCNDEGISFGQTAIAEKGKTNVSCSTTETCGN